MGWTYSSAGEDKYGIAVLRWVSGPSVLCTGSSQEPAQDRVQWEDLVLMVLNLRNILAYILSIGITVPENSSVPHCGNGSDFLVLN
jgi:hypothetical protein